MIEVFESRLRFLTHCSQRERLLAAAAQTVEARRIHQKLAQMYEREATRIDR
ncbi:hypothetical protein [Rhizorhabdus dicambivorans]|uniref:hypothetical protein n=1 Tax=Rhizorhabdus dicambivorans TaxID=1850238 RepID=UPI001863BBD0|nr:hypothetical protein [Rhizorhabdus dicambivorans]